MLSSPKISALVSAIINLLTIGVLGSFPLFLITTPFSSWRVGLEIWFIGAFLVASWLPMRMFIFQLVSDGSGNLTVPLHIPQRLLIVLLPVVIPILWSMTALPLLWGLLAYFGLGRSLVGGLVGATLYQWATFYLQARRARKLGGQDTSFTYMYQVWQNSGLDTLVIDSGNSTSDEPITREANVIYHPPAQTSTPRRLQHDDEEIIIIDPDETNQHNQQD